MKPILFNTEMAKAILAGRKTATRRLIKPQPPSDNAYLRYIKDGFARFGWEHSTALCDRKLPYQPGDVLYVRETWCKVRSLTSGVERYLYRADDSDFYCHWKPSIHMPKEAARIFLRVTNVRVERLQDISGQGLIDEGLYSMKELRNGMIKDKFSTFESLWNSAVKKSDLAKYGWTANPWVFVIEFWRISKEEALKNDKQRKIHTVV